MIAMRRSFSSEDEVVMEEEKTGERVRGEGRTDCLLALARMDSDDLNIWRGGIIQHSRLQLY